MQQCPDAGVIEPHLKALHYDIKIGPQSRENSKVMPVMYVQGIHVSRIHAIGIISIEREGRSSRVKEKHHVAIQIPEMSHTLE